MTNIILNNHIVIMYLGEEPWNVDTHTHTQSNIGLGLKSPLHYSIMTILCDRP